MLTWEIYTNEGDELPRRIAASAYFEAIAECQAHYAEQTA